MWHWLIVAMAVLVLFGSKKLPDAARSLGRSLRIFKSEVRELHGDDEPAVRSVNAASQTAVDSDPEPFPPPEQRARRD
ncbi:Sec-independent protein translocase subunit TatA [Actinoallomurus purpureus]|uniref:Sec-independent protein translocase subunit TatA n=1 Tax=Actinoallomurus purpureus TaxID=478114 RepID=UPI0020932042|nr:Sec-independent protein translocase subunit TatA [Actinoallomurus purpureus]